MLKKVLIFYPSFESGGATKNLIKIIRQDIDILDTEKKGDIILFLKELMEKH